jgi:hypothetical protein
MLTIRPQAMEDIDKNDESNTCSNITTFLFVIAIVLGWEMIR